MSEELWTALRLRCENCRACPLSATRTNLVLGTGSRTADLMFVGEAPGEQEDLEGIPFVGKAGQLLDRYLFAVGIPRETVYIANILKCRPPRNRDPLPEEEEACIGYLREQVKLVDPKIIVCLGRISAMRLITPDFRITRDHGQFVRKGKYLMTAVYHPAALLRDPSKKEDMLLDMERIKAKLDTLADGNIT
jgi:DNA polymerase